MNKTAFSVKDRYGKVLHAVKWEPAVSSPRAVVQISHGMAEHIERYNHFARFLTDHGFAVFAHDHRGHGKTDPEHPGFISGADGFHRQVENLRDVRDSIQNQFPNLPRFFFAHSMGSFLLQRFLQLFEDRPAGIIYSGSNGRPPLSLSFGILLSSVLMKLSGPEKKSPLLHSLTFGAYNKPFKPSRTDMDWLSRDPEMVDLYMDDPLCGFVCTTSFYNHFFQGLRTLHAHKPFAGHDSNIPVFIVSGGSDPVSNMSKGIRSLEKILKDSGVSDLTVQIYPDARHELLNEINRKEVMQDLLNWMDRVLTPGS